VLAGLLAVAGCARGQSARPGDPAVRVDSLIAGIEAARIRLQVPGAAVVLVTAERVLLLRGFGLRSVADSLPVTPDTRFLLGSCTKPFTALAAAIGLDRGVLSLDDPPRRFLPWFRLADAGVDARVTLRDLLSHRTGVPDDLREGWYERHGTSERLIRAAMQSRATGAFRTSFHYNNYLFSAAGAAVAAAFAAPYEDVVRREILDPLGMAGSGFSLPAVEASGDFAYGYADSGRTTVAPTGLIWSTIIAPAASLHSSARDLSAWLRMLAAGGLLDGRRLLSDSAFGAMLEPAVRTAAGRYSLGWFVEDWHGMRLYSHPGGVSGYGTGCEFLPERGLGWAVLTNVDDRALPRAVRELIHQLFVQQPLPGTRPPG